MTIAAILRRRRAEQRDLIARASDFSKGLRADLDVRGVCVFGSVARGDFNIWSDIDVLIVADLFPPHPWRRLDVLEPIPPGVQPVAWNIAEWHTQSVRRNPIAEEARSHGIWLIGGADQL